MRVSPEFNAYGATNEYLLQSLDLCRGSAGSKGTRSAIEV